MYDLLPSHRSWVSRLLLFLGDPSVSLFGRVARDSDGEPLPTAATKARYATASFDETSEGAV